MKYQGSQTRGWGAGEELPNSTPASPCTGDVWTILRRPSEVGVAGKARDDPSCHIGQIKRYDVNMPS